MKELEKILEEIVEEQRSYEADHAWNYARGLEQAADIIRKHISRENDPETTRSSRDTEDDWISVKKRVGITPEEAIMWLKDDIKEIDRDYADGEINDAYAQEGAEIYKMAIEAIKEVQKYRMIENATIGEIVEALKEFSEIGTVEECREAVEKQKAKKCVKDSCPDHIHYKCPSCGQIELSIYKHGFPRLGRITKYCENCGQALIDESQEGMEDAVSND